MLTIFNNRRYITHKSHRLRDLNMKQSYIKQHLPVGCSRVNDISRLSITWYHTHCICSISLVNLLLQPCWQSFAHLTSKKLEHRMRAQNMGKPVYLCASVNANWQSFRSFHYPLTNMSFLVWLMDHCEPEDRVNWRLRGEWWLLKDHKEPLGDGSVEDYSKAF